MTQQTNGTMQESNQGSASLQASKFQPQPITNTAVVNEMDHGAVGVPTATSESVIRLDEGTVQNITNFADKADVISDVSRLSGNKHFQAAYGELNLRDFLERPYPIGQINWTSATGEGDLISAIDVVSALFSQSSISSKLANYQYIRFNLEISFRTNATTFHQGRLLAAWKPYYNNMVAKAYYDNLYSSSGFQHTQIEPTASATPTIVIPFLAPSNYLAIEDNSFISDYGILQVYCVAPLDAIADTVPDVSVTIWAKLTNVELAGPKGISTFESGLEGFVKSVKDVVTGVASAVPSVMSSITPILNAGETLAPLVAMADMPNSQQAYVPIQLRNARCSNTEGLNNSDMLAVCPDNSVSACHDLLGMAHDEMDLMDIIQTPTLVDIFTVTESMTLGTEFGTMPLSTLPGPSFLRFISSAFKYWRGSLRFHFQVVATNFHSFRFRIAYQPYQAQATGFDVDETSNMINTIVDIKTQSEVSILVPYVANRPWQTVTGSNYNSLGVLVLQTASLLTASSSPVPDLKVLVWVSAGSDFQLAGPLSTETTVVSPSTELEAGNLETVKHADYVPMIESKSYKDDNVCMGENVTNLKHLLMRHVPVYLMTGSMYYDPLGGSIFDSATSGGYFPSFIRYFSTIFRFMRGSFNARLVPKTQTTAACSLDYSSSIPDSRVGVSTVPYDDIVAGFSRGGEFISDRAQTLSVTVPYYSNAKFLFTDKFNGAFQAYYNRPFLRIGLSDETETATLLEAVGDDFTFGYRIGVPIAPTEKAKTNTKLTYELTQQQYSQHKEQAMKRHARSLARLKEGTINLFSS